MLFAQELTSEELWTVVADVASGLRHIHERGKIHLDIKPDNIFLTEEVRTQPPPPPLSLVLVLLLLMLLLLILLVLVLVLVVLVLCCGD